MHYIPLMKPKHLKSFLKQPVLFSPDLFSSSCRPACAVPPLTKSAAVILAFSGQVSHLRKPVGINILFNNFIPIQDTQEIGYLIFYWYIITEIKVLTRSCSKPRLKKPRKEKTKGSSNLRLQSSRQEKNRVDIFPNNMCFSVCI